MTYHPKRHLKHAIRWLTRSRAGRFTLGCAVGATTVAIYFTFATGGADVYVPVYGWASAGLAAIGGCIVGGYYSIHGVPFRPRG
jgi:hypothetical protein